MQEDVLPQTSYGSGVLDRGAQALPALGTFVLRYGLVLFLVMFGALKWTKGEADGIQPLMAHSPLFSWMYSVWSVQHASEAVGVVELLVASMMVSRRFFPRVSAWGSVLAIGMFLTTLSFLVTTPHLDDGTQGFLMKDLILLGAALHTAGEAFRASSPQGADRG